MYHIVSSICTMLLSRLQTRCKHPIYSYPNVQARLSFCTYFLLYPLVITLQDWSVNHVRELNCQPCMEATQLDVHSSQVSANFLQSWFQVKCRGPTFNTVMYLKSVLTSNLNTCNSFKVSAVVYLPAVGGLNLNLYLLR